MQIIISQPPNIEEIRQVFTFTRRVIFAYDGDIYNPDNIYISPAMIAHEEVHFEQQAAVGVKEWWAAYFRDPQFRSIQEIPAYRRQYEVAKLTILDRNKRLDYARKLAEALSGDTYGNCIPFNEALKAITS